MAVSASALRRLATLNLSPEQMAGVLELLAEQADAEEARLKAQRERKARQRAGQSRDSHGTVTVMSGDSPPMVPLSSPPNPLTNPPLNPPQVPPSPTGTPPQSKSGKPLRRLPEDWAPSPEQRARWKARGATDGLLDSSLEDLRTWANGKGVTRADWAAVYDGFVKRDLAAGGVRPAMNGHSRGPPPEPPLSGATQVLHALQRRQRNERPDEPPTVDLDLRDGRSH